MENLNFEISNPVQLPIYLMESINELYTIFMNSTTKYNRYGDYIENGVITNCSKPFQISDNIEYCIGIYQVICILIFSMMVKRISFKKDTCYGRPGLVPPMHMLNSHDYIVEYTLVFLALSEDIYNLIFGMKETLGNVLPIAKFFFKLFMVVIISIFSYPYFAAICGRRLVWYLMVVLSAIVFLCIGIISTYVDYFCVVGVKVIPLVFTAAVFCTIELLLICMFLWKIISHVKRNGWSLKETSKVTHRARDYSFMYVKELLKERFTNKSKYEEESDNSENGVKVILKNFDCNELRMKIKESIYRQIPGFSIPPRLMIGICVGLYFAYRIFINNIYDLTPGAWNLIANLDAKLPTTELNLKTSFQLVSGNYSLYETYKIQNAFRHLTFFYARLLISCFITAVFIGLINSIIQTFLLLRNYRLHFHKLTRKGFSSMIDIKKAPEPHGLIIGFVKYSGYQASYTLWGILVVTVFIFLLLFFLIGIFLLPLIYLENSWARKVVVNYGPVLVASIIFNFLQSLFVKYVFVKEHGSLMEVNNRIAFIIYTHCAFFLNAMMGMFNSIKRIIIWVFTGVFSFSRIDFSSLPEYLHGFDNGYMCYIGFLYTEQYHFNPIMQCFSHILLETIESPEQYEYRMINNSEKEKRRLRYRNLWHLSLTLINNQKLLTERKLFLKGQLLD